MVNNIIEHKHSTELEYFCYYRLYDESPRWYLSKGNMKKCREVLRRITTTNGHNLDALNLKVTLLSLYTHLYMRFGQSYYDACMCGIVHNTLYYLHVTRPSYVHSKALSQKEKSLEFIHACQIYFQHHHMHHCLV